MESILQWVASNGPQLLLTATGVVTGASVLLKPIAKWTDNTVDDRVLAVLVKVRNALAKISLNTDIKKSGKGEK